MGEVHFLPFPYSYRCPFGVGGEKGSQASIAYIARYWMTQTVALHPQRR